MAVRTGLRSMYRAAASVWAASIGHDANRPCHRYPRHPSRKLIARVYRQWARPTAGASR